LLLVLRLAVMAMMMVVLLPYHPNKIDWDTHTHKRTSMRNRK